MKKVLAVLLVLACAVIFTWGCKSKKPLQFCEGTNAEGEPVHCGTTFTTGDLTAFLSLEEAAGEDSITVNILEKQDYKNQPYNTHTHEVDPDKKQITFPVSLYKEGTFIVQVQQGETKLAEGELKMVDTY